MDEYNLSDDRNESFLRFPVQDIYKLSDKRIVVGRIESGKINIDDDLLVLPSNEKVKLNLLKNGQSLKMNTMRVSA